MPVVLAGSLVLPLAARWQLRAAGSVLDRQVRVLNVLPTGFALPRALVRDRRSWRALGRVWLASVVGAGAFVVTVAPLVSFVDVLVELADGAAARFDAAVGPMLSRVWSEVVWLGPGRLDGADLETPSQAVAVAGVELLVAMTWLLFVVPVFARLHARATCWLMSLRATVLEEGVGELTATRAGAVDAHTAELRRVERDLHDGMQAHLVNVAMRLGMAERRLADEPAAVGTLLEDARAGTEEAMSGLRDVLRSMYPPVLADRGLRGALLGLAGRATTPTTVEMPDDVDVPAPVEAAAYFVVAEALTNVAKHSAASHADVTLRREPEALVVEVTDNGLGGADEGRGTGIVGMRRRVAALDGWLELTSPPGGPTVVVAELPCGL